MNINNLLIECSDYTSAFITTYTDDFNFDSLNDNLLNKKYFFNIYTSDDDLNKQQQIGKIEMTYMDVIMAQETGYGTSMLFDMIDSEKQGVYNYLFNDDEANEEYVGMDRDVIYIDKIFIGKKFRNIGIGSRIIQLLPSLIRKIFKLKPGCIVLFANPFELVDDELKFSIDKSKIEELIRFYTKNGFVRIKDTQYLVKNMDFQ